MIKIKKFYSLSIPYNPNQTDESKEYAERIGKPVEEQCEKFIAENNIRVISMSVVAIDNKPKLYLMYEEQNNIPEDWEWECEKSPNGYCAYAEDDGMKDFCIYCGQPEERK